MIILYYIQIDKEWGSLVEIFLSDTTCIQGITQKSDLDII